MKRFLIMIFVASLTQQAHAGLKAGAVNIRKAINQSDTNLTIGWFEDNKLGYEAIVGPTTSPILKDGGTYIQWCQSHGGNFLRIITKAGMIDMCDKEHGTCTITGNVSMVDGVRGWGMIKPAIKAGYKYVTFVRNGVNQPTPDTFTIALDRYQYYYLVVKQDGHIYFLEEAMTAEHNLPSKDLKYGYPTETSGFQ